MRTLEKEGLTTSERRARARRSALPMSAVEQALRSNVADNPFTRSNHQNLPLWEVFLRLIKKTLYDRSHTAFFIKSFI